MVTITKDEVFFDSIIRFLKSNQRTYDYICLFATFKACTSSEDGLTWNKIEEMLNKALKQ